MDYSKKFFQVNFVFGISILIYNYGLTKNYFKANKKGEPSSGPPLFIKNLFLLILFQ